MVNYRIKLSLPQHYGKSKKIAAALSDETLGIICKTFSVENLRDSQKSAINDILEGRDVFVSTRTGSRKSLIYQSLSQVFKTWGKVEGHVWDMTEAITSLVQILCGLEGYGASRLFTLPSRSLSSSETATALRPFYFTVHPDLFGKHPKERAVNEDSLKKLNEYVTSLQAKRPVKESKVMFYARLCPDSELEEEENCFRKIEISLLSKDLRKAVTDILSSCALPLDYVNAIESKSLEELTSMKIDWHHSYYSYTGKQNPEEVINKVPEITLRGWLQKNAERARQKQEASQPVRDEIDRLCKHLKHQIGLADIIWASVWGFSHFRGCLKSFERLHTEHKEKINGVLRGRRLLFSNCTGVSLHGDVVLSSEDVPTDWMRLLKSVPAYDTVLERLPYMEEQLSGLLSNIQLIRQRQQRIVMADNYELLLNKLINSLRRCQDNVTSNFFAEDLSHLELVIDSEEGPLALSPTGQFLVPATQPGALMVDFIAANKSEAAYLLCAMPKYVYLEQNAFDRCVSELELHSLLKDDMVTSPQMASCCERLVADCLQIGSTMRDACLRVSHYYTVMEDGQIRIPWDWKGDIS